MYNFVFTKIGDANRSAFGGLIPPEFAERLGADPNVCALGAVLDDEAAGAVVFEVGTDEAVILSLVAAPHAAHTSCAVELLDEVAAAARKSGRIAALSAVFACESAAEQNALAASYKAAGFAVRQSEMAQFSLDSEKLAGSPELARKREDSRVRCLDGFSDVDYFKLNALLKASGNAYIDTPVTSESVIPALSMAHEDASGKTDGALLFNNPTADGCSLALMVFRDRRASAGALPMLQKALGKIREQYPGGATIRVSAVSVEARRLVYKLAPGAIVNERPAHHARLELRGPDRSESNEKIFNLMQK